MDMVEFAWAIRELALREHTVCFRMVPLGSAGTATAPSITYRAPDCCSNAERASVLSGERH
jgi:hypothetical protein